MAARAEEAGVGAAGQAETVAVPAVLAAPEALMAGAGRVGEPAGAGLVGEPGGWTGVVSADEPGETRSIPEVAGRAGVHRGRWAAAGHARIRRARSWAPRYQAKVAPNQYQSFAGCATEADVQRYF